jgi:hypothetical protein
MKAFVTILVIALVVLAAYFIFWQDNEVDGENNEQVFCTMDAKLCPDGSYVGRVAPSCEFAACPASTGAPTSTPAIDGEVQGDFDVKL